MRRADDRTSPPAWGYPDPFTGALIYPADDTDEPRLRAAGLPVLRDLEGLADHLGISWRRVLWLASPSPRYAMSSPHYSISTRPKALGGNRLIIAPKSSLKAVQRTILRTILSKIALSDRAHGFRPGRSIVTNARPHANADVVVRFDLSDFFHSVTYRRVRGLFRSLGYSTEVSVLLALLTTFRPDTYPFEHRRHVSQLDWLDAVGQRARTFRRYPTTPPFLPQGAPTSPAIANLVSRRLDARLAGLARVFEARYTRYADDMTFSGGAALRAGLRRFIPHVRRIARREGFRLRPEKTKVQRKGGRQRVTGLVVNRKPNVPREDYRRLRAMLHNAAKNGVHTVHLADGPAEPERLRQYFLGWIAFVSNVDHARGERLRAAFDRIPWPAG